MVLNSTNMVRSPFNNAPGKSPFGTRYTRKPSITTHHTGTSPVIWVVVLVALIMVGVLVYILTHKEDSQQAQTTKKPAASVSATEPTPTEQKAEEKPALTVLEKEVPQPDKKKKPAQKQSTQKESAPPVVQEQPQKKSTEKADDTKQEAPIDNEDEPTTESESEDADEEEIIEDTPTEEDEEEQPLQLNNADDAAWLAKYNALVNSKLEEYDYNGLRDALKEAITASDAGIFEAAENTQKKAKEDEEATPSPYDDIPSAVSFKVKAKSTKQALAAYYCLELFLAEEQELSSDENRNFMRFLLASDGKPAADFFKGLQKKKVTASVAAELLGELRAIYDEEPKKAAKKIPSIMAASGKMQIRKYYPSDKKAIEKKITDLLKTKPSGGADKAQQEAINLANVYRYICGVAPSLKFDKTYFKQAEDAAAACARAGRIAHDLGHSTDLCNLHQGMDSRAKSIPGYIEDPGDHNRKERGHRNWILDPAAGKTAFGQSGIFHAMRVMDRSSNEKQKYAHSYPGRGYFPARYLHGDGWSYHALPGISVGENPKVEMWRLLSAPKHPVTKADLSPAREIDVKEVFANGNYLVFEPDYSDTAFKRRSDGSLQGVYWIRISWKGFKDEYLVEFY